MKRLLLLLLLTGLAQAMQPAFRPQPSLGGLPTELKSIIFGKIIERDKSVALTKESRDQAAQDLKSILLTNKQFAAFANPETINALIIAFGTNWTDNNFNEAADLLLRVQLFEKNNPSLATHINRLITQWKINYAQFAESVRNNNWERVKAYIQQGLPIHDVVRDTLLSIRLNGAQKEKKLAELIAAGADAQIVNNLKKELCPILEVNRGPRYIGCYSDEGEQINLND